MLANVDGIATRDNEFVLDVPAESVLDRSAGQAGLLFNLRLGRRGVLKKCSEDEFGARWKVIDAVLWR